MQAYRGQPGDNRATQVRDKIIWCLVFCVWLLAWGAGSALAAETSFLVSEGFEVSLYADEKLASDIYTLAIDSCGRVVVAGRGYVRILVDEEGDGRADRAITFSETPKDGAMGMLWEGRTLFATGDGGLWRYCDADGDDRADGPGELVCKLKTGGEHAAHALRRGPDGFLYVLCGNNTGIDRSYARRPDSPLHEPIAGAVLRFDPDLARCEIFADGFRNAYDMDFSLEGELFAYDSDNERCVSLPWYEPTRFYHVLPGSRHGWLSPQRTETWRMPPYWPDVAAPAAPIARGSPTGVACYRHLQFPERYRGGFFLLDWTFGKVHFVPLVRLGASYTGQPEVFIEPRGDNGFAPTDAGVHPETGDLFLSIGGRGTRGAVYRVTYPAGRRSFSPAELARFAPAQPRWDWSAERTTELLQLAVSADELQRFRALESLRRGAEHLSAEQIERVVLQNWGHADRYLRQAAGRLLKRLPPPRRGALLEQARTPLEVATWCLALADTVPPEVIAPAARLLGELAETTRGKSFSETSQAAGLAALRALQIAAGDVGASRHHGTVFEGYSRRGRLDLAGALPVLRQVYPIGAAHLDREMTRLLAMLEDAEPSVRRRVAEQLSATSDPLDDIHHLIVLARLAGPRSRDETTRAARALLSLDRKLAGRNRDRNWPLRIGELYAELARKDPRLPAALLADEEFGRPEHARFASAGGFPRERAARVFLERLRRDADFEWSAALVDLLSHLPAPEVMPLLRRQWENLALRDSIAPVLARDPQVEDVPRFLSALDSANTATLRSGITALEQLPKRLGPEEILVVLRAARRLGDEGEGPRLRRRLLEYLTAAVPSSAQTLPEWVEWFVHTYPNLAEPLLNPDGVDAAKWAERLARIDWSRGERSAGRAVFQQAACASCHSGVAALGPDLRGAAARFSRQDLFTAIVQPSRDISARYQTTVLVDADGALYQGVILYEAVDAVILQTGPEQTVRLDAGSIVGRRPGSTSLMPTGLLDRLSDAQIADLYAYLKSLE